MPQQAHGRLAAWTSRQAQFEALEARLVLSGHPLGDFQVDYLFEDAAGATGPQKLADVHAQTGLAEVRQKYGFAGSGQTVAVIDSGIAWDHMALGEGFGPGYRVVGGWDFAENDAVAYDDGPLGSHGTHVAGIIGADAGLNSGVAPGVDLVALRVFDDAGTGYFEWVEEALEWVHDNRNALASPITTVNMSLGTSTNSDTIPGWAMLEDELAQLEADGIFVAVAAGNGFQEYGLPGLSYPAGSQYVVPVMSVDPSGDLSYFSQRDDRAIAAPGRSITSTVPDYVGNQNGRQDDFAAYSGTSMASPYVAGASVLVREAMELVEYTDIDQDSIYEVLMAAADPFYDAATNREYKQLDLAAALDAIMPEDDFGSTPASAWNMGTLSNATSIEGFIGTLSDADYFSFTAGVSGTVTWNVENSLDQAVLWHVSDAAHSIDEQQRLTLDVEVGQTYTVGVSTSDGLGYYTLSVEFDAVPTYTDLGVVDFLQVDNLSRHRNGPWYRLETTREGLLTIDALSSEPSDDVDLALYDANLNLLTSTGSHSNHWRLDVATEGAEVYYLRVTTADTDIDLRVANVISVTDDGVEVYGTQADDVFRFAIGPQYDRLLINGIDYRLNASETEAVRLYGRGGQDAISVIGGEGTDRGFIRAGQFELTGDGYSIAGDGFEQIRLYGRGTNDEVRIYGSSTADNLVMTPEHVRLAGDGYYAFVEAFALVRVYGTSGADTAFVFDSPNDDNYVAAATHVRMAGEGFYRFAEGFEISRAFASTGDDVAFMYGSMGDDTLVADPRHVQFTGASFNNTVSGFDRVVGYAAEGLDKAYFYGTAGRFEYTQAYANNTSVVAYLFGLTRNDLLTATARSKRFEGAGHLNQVRGFGHVSVYASEGTDAAVFSNPESELLAGGPSDSASVSYPEQTAEVFALDIATAVLQLDSGLMEGMTPWDHFFEQLGHSD